MQSRLQSFIESNANVFIGYWINIGVQMIVFPLYGMTVSFFQNIQIGLIFMAVAIVRSYTIRRLFNARLHHGR